MGSINIKNIFTILLLVFFLSSKAFAFAEKINFIVTPWVVPLLGSTIVDIETMVETSISEKNSLTLGLTYFSQSCFDCSPSGSKSGNGVSLYHRYYLNQINENGFVLISGFEMAKARTTTNRNGSITKGNGIISDLEAIIAKRVVSEKFILEFGVGLRYRIGEVIADNSGGYKRGFGPVLHIGFGYLL